MYVVHNRIDSPPNEMFEQHFATSMRSTLGGVPGLRRAVLLRPGKPGQPYVATMEFDSEESFLAWTRSDAFRAAHGNRAAPGMQASSALEVFSVVEDVSA